MPFRPNPNDAITIADSTYTFTEHPAAPGMAYGQAGRRGTVYQLKDEEGGLWALKVFFPQFREPRLAGQAERIQPYSSLPGLQAAARTVLTGTGYRSLIRQHSELAYAVFMPWVPGCTWLEQFASRKPLEKGMALALVQSLINTLALMEERGLAHCDLSGPNLILTPHNTVELVDLEEMYGPGLMKPRQLPGGSPGYSHNTAPDGLWREEADRFAGAVLAGEMLGASVEDVWKYAWDEGYFKPDEVQTNSEAFHHLHGILNNHWGRDVGSLFHQVWFAETLNFCPTFAEWLAALPDEVPEPVSEEDAHLEEEPEPGPLLSIPASPTVQFDRSVHPPDDTGLLDAFLPDGPWKCPVCDRENPVDTAICLYCEKGTPSEPEAGRWVCPECGKENSKGTSICLFCEVGTAPGVQAGEAVEFESGLRFKPWMAGAVLAAAAVVIAGVFLLRPEPASEPVSEPGEIQIPLEQQAELQGETAAVVEPLPVVGSADTPVPTAETPVGVPLPLENLAVLDGMNAAGLRELERIGSGMVNDLALSSDGLQLALVTSRGLRIFNAETLQELNDVLVTDEAVSSAAWSPDDTSLALGMSNGEVHCYDPGDWSVLWKVEVFSRTGVVQVEWSPDGQYLAVRPGYIGDNAQLPFIILDVSSGDEILSIVPHENDFDGMAMSSQGQLATWGGNVMVNEQGVLVWDIPSGLLVGRYEAPWWVDEAVWSPDGEKIAVLKNGNAAQYIWDVEDNAIRSVNLGEPLNYGAVTWERDPEGLVYATGTGMYFFDLLEESTGVLRPFDADGRSPFSIEYSDLDKNIFLRFGWYGVGFLDPMEAEEVTQLPGLWGGIDVSWSHSGDVMGLYTSSQGWSCSGGDPYDCEEIPASGSLSWSHDDRYVLAQGSMILDVDTWQQKEGTENFEHRYASGVWSPVENNLARAMNDPVLYDVDTGSFTYLERISEGDLAVAFNPTTGDLASIRDAAGGRSGELVIWDVDALSRLRTLQGPDNFDFMAYSSTGAYLAVSSWPSDYVDLYDSNWGRESIEGTAVSWSPEDRLLAVYREGGITLLDFSTREELIFLPGQASVADWKPDGTVLATRDEDGSLVFWGIPEE